MKDGSVLEVNERPHNPLVEISLIGALIADNKTYYKIQSLVHKDDFYSPVHSKVFATISSLAQEGRSFDAIVLKEKLQSLNILDEIGGTAYIDKAEIAACTSIVAESYAAIVKDLSMRREVAAISSKFHKESTNPNYEGDSKELVARLIGDISSVTVERDNKQGFSTTEDAVTELFEGDSGRVITTGIQKIDDDWPIMTSGVTIVAGRPSHGKSTLAVELASGAAKNGNRVDFYTLEMSKSQVAARMISSDLCLHGKETHYRSIYRKDLREGLSQEDLMIIKQAARELPVINWNDASSMTTSDMICNSMSNKAIKDKVDLMVIDYIDNVSHADMQGNDMRWDQKVGSIVHRFRKFAKDNDCAVILVVQLNRKTMDSNLGRPQLSGLKNSGEIEQHADTVLFTYKKSNVLKAMKPLDDMDTEELAEYNRCENKIEIICGKQRMGETSAMEFDCSIWCNHIAPKYQRGI